MVRCRFLHILPTSWKTEPDIIRYMRLMKDPLRRQLPASLYTGALKEIQEKGVDIARVTLHVGLGTFRPVKVEDVTEHHMHSEFYMVDAEASEKINRAKEHGGRVICVGTTSCRTIDLLRMRMDT